MKQKIKILVSLLFVITFSIVFVACDNNISAVYQSAINNGLQNVSQEELKNELKGTNGVDGADGKDGDSIDLYEIYNQLKDSEEYSGSYSDFIKEYLNVPTSVYSTNKALRSVVSIYCGFSQTINYQKNNTLQTFESKSYCAGSGVIFRLDKESGDAYIITNYHVVYSCDANKNISDDINLLLYGQSDYQITQTDSISISGFFSNNTYSHEEFYSPYAISATFLGGSLQYDIAVLKVSNSEQLKNSDAIEANFADSDNISVGESVFTVGNPSALGIACTSGIVSVDSETIEMVGADNSTACSFRVIRTDAAINSGNSGGGLFNSNGELVGIVNAKIVSSSIENIGYAIPSNVACNIAKNIIKNCDGETNTTLKRCFIGITIYVSAKKSVYNNETLTYDKFETVSIDSTQEGFGAYGLFDKDDIITSIDVNYFSSGQISTKQITKLHQVHDITLVLSVGDVVTIHRTDANGIAKDDVVITITDSSVVEYY